MTDEEIEFHVVAQSGDVNEDEPVAVTVGRVDIGLYKLDGEIYALDDICPHAYACLSDGYIDEGQIECPLHGAGFDIKTGKALTAPASIDLRVYPVKIDGDQISVGLPKTNS